MIVLPSISQTFYKIGNDSIVGYSLDDNRRIALILQSEKFYRDSYKTLLVMEQTSTMRLEVAYQIIDRLELANNEFKQVSALQNDKIELYSKQNKSLRRRNKTLIIGGVTVSVGVLILAILK